MYLSVPVTSGVAVLVGYNKNVAQYMREALAALTARREAGQVWLRVSRHRAADLRAQDAAPCAQDAAPWAQAAAPCAQVAPLVTLEHCNAFKPGQELVDFLAGPGGEGMLHNMARTWQRMAAHGSAWQRMAAHAY